MWRTVEGSDDRVIVSDTSAFASKASGESGRASVKRRPSGPTHPRCRTRRGTATRPHSTLCRPCCDPCDLPIKLLPDVLSNGGTQARKSRCLLNSNWLVWSPPQVWRGRQRSLEMTSKRLNFINSPKTPKTILSLFFEFVFLLNKLTTH